MVSPNIKQAWVSLGVILNLLAGGMMGSYPYSLLPALRAEDTPIKINIEAGSWLASIISIAIVPGCIICAWLMEFLGRRRAIILMMVPAVLGWGLIHFARNLTTLMIGRLLTGLSYASSLILGCAMIGEYISPEYRALVLGAKTAALTLGNLIMHIISNHFDWRTIALLCCIPHILVACNAFTLPESPSWLAKRRKFKESEEAFYWLRGTDELSVKECEALIQAQKKRTANLSNERTFWVSVTYYIKLFTRKDVFKPIFIIIVAFVLLEACGRHTFPAYASDIMGEINKSLYLSSYVFTISVDIVATISSTVSCILTKFVRRRVLLFFSGIFCILLLGIVSLYLYFVSIGILSKDMSWIPLSLVVVLFAVANLGCSSLPVTYFGELFPLSDKGVTSAVTSIFTTTPLIIGMKVTPGMMASIKVHGMFTVQAVTMAVCLLYLYFTLPETKNKTLLEIEYFFNHGRFLDDEKKLTNNDEKDETSRILNIP